MRSFLSNCLVVLLICALLGQSTGCSLFQPKMQTVTITSVPPGADITVNGQDMGKAPVSIQLERNKNHSIIAALGSRTTVRELNSKFSQTGVLDVIGTIFFLVPGLGLLSPGAWELDSTNVVMQLPQR
ncbi:MAG: PEGA domain-containing protein [Tepidisphaeraceae bacterium]